MYDFYSTKAFENAFTYTGSDLGAVWSREKTCFRLWAPTAKAVSVNLYKSGTAGTDDLIQRVPMEPSVNGTWVAEKAGDLNGIYYTYLVSVGGKTVEACDPYARTTGVNGNRAMVIDLASTDPQGWENDTDPHAGAKITDAVLYELHVRDLSMDKSSGIKNKGKFLGLIESGTKTKDGIPTGLDHMKDLGITHLHLLPVYDFGFTDESLEKPQFNWGYDPVNFNVPEGSFSTDPFNGAVRVKEMKQMVKGLHDNGISVVMDVVYNHVYETFDFCFNKIVPGYFSRISGTGVVSDASCCGNDTASERAMVKKYIVDSVNYWADEYHIDGFRFDLVGLIDTETINEIMDTVHAQHPSVIFYGEGWSMHTGVTKPGYHMTVQGNSGMVPGFAFFSDTIRDLLRGSVFDNTLPGFISGAVCSRDQLDACFMGVPMWAAAPAQSVNYVSCHDNNTLFDRIALATPKASQAERIKMNNLAAAFTIMSQGVPFMQAGEEMLRTKPAKDGGFDHNSYRAPDSVNSMKWADLSKEEYKKTYAYYKGLLAFRKAHPSLHLTTRDQVWKTVHPVGCYNPHTAAFLIDGEEDHRIFAAFNADTQGVSLTLPEGKWQVCIRDDVAGTESLAELGGSLTVSPKSAIVLVQKKAAKPVDVVAALLWEKDKFLIAQRPATKARGLLWEFVGGKAEAGESLPQALIRECKEELDVTVGVGPQFMQVTHEYPDILIRLTLFHAIIPEGFPKALEHNEIRWIHPSEIDQYQFCPADADILKEIKRMYGSKKPL